MADDLSFTISAQDQASRSIETVQKKIQGFGSDVAKLALGVVGPMALLQTGIGYVTEKWSEYQQAQKDAFEAGAKPVYDEIKAQQELGVQLDKNLSAILATAKIKEEIAKSEEDIKTQESQARQAFIDSEAGQTFVKKRIKESGGIVTLSNEEIDAAAKAEGARINAEIKKKKDAEDAKKAAEKAAADEEKKKQKELPELNKVNEKIKEAQKNLAQGGALTGEDLINQLSGDLNSAVKESEKLKESNASRLDIANAELKVEEAKIKLRDEQKKQTDQQIKDQAALAVQKAKDDEALQKSLANVEKSSGRLTVSSLREIGGSFGGGDVSTGLDRQIELSQKQIDVLTTIAQNTTPKSDVGESKPVGSTNFTSEDTAMYSIAWYINQNK
jgi:hypothetical protein